MSAIAGSFALPSVFPNSATPLGGGAVWQSPGAINQIPDLRSRPRRRLYVERIYLPVAGETTNADATKPVNEAFPTVSARVNGALLWTYSSPVPMVPSAGGGFSFANGAIAQDLNNPLTIDVHEVAEIFFSISFDQAVNGWSFGIGYQQTTLGTQTPSPGAAYYTTD